MSIREQLERAAGRAMDAPPWVWVAVAGGALWWATRPKPSSSLDGGTPKGSEDVQVLPLQGEPVYNPIGAHAVGLPYALGHHCPVSWTGRTKGYPTDSSGVIGMMAAPDPADDDGYPWLSYGRGRGPVG